MSHAAMSAPTAIGNDDLTCCSFIEWSTTDLRSPWCSCAPSSAVNFFAWKIDLSASGVGDHWPFVFWRQRSGKGESAAAQHERVCGAY